MSMIKIRATSLALCPYEPDREFRIIAKGDGEKFISIESNMPEYEEEFIESLTRRRSFLMRPSGYLPIPGTMLNFVAVICFLWWEYPSRLVIDQEGFIGEIPNEKGKAY